MRHTTTKEAKLNEFSSLGYYLMVIANRVSFTILVLVSLFFIIFSKTNEAYTDNVRYAFYKIAYPIILSVEKPVNGGIWVVKNAKKILLVVNENEKLLAENKFYKKKYIESLNIQSENEQLRKLLNFVTYKTDFEYQVAYIKGNIKGQDGANIIITAGTNDGLENGYVVMGSEGVVGRVASVSNDDSKVILITDLNSKIPVVVASENQRNKGILTGENSDYLTIVYLNEKHNIKKGDKVFTSGDGESIPSGLYIGNVISVDKDEATILPVEDFNNLDLVLILKRKFDKEKRK